MRESVPQKKSSSKETKQKDAIQLDRYECNHPFMDRSVAEDREVLLSFTYECPFYHEPFSFSSFDPFNYLILPRVTSLPLVGSCHTYSYRLSSLTMRNEDRAKES
jgi:hypothetical protein